ncbi:hypothetical protein WN944_010989 [Citrus x changshan-huyou]|uniref:Uncharacterized protein n=1 Tax=Citrus x changshan-huyou TaxID=2935761 RepID=A0AAP0QXR5_9ROSI
MYTYRNTFAYSLGSTGHVDVMCFCVQPMLDVPIYGRITTLELFCPYGEA